MIFGGRKDDVFQIWGVNVRQHLTFEGRKVEPKRVSGEEEKWKVYNSSYGRFRYRSCSSEIMERISLYDGSLKSKWC